MKANWWRSLGKRRRPRLSLVLVVYRMPVQARNTIRSLLPDYQRGVSRDDYEVVIVENRSREVLDPGFLRGLPFPTSCAMKLHPHPCMPSTKRRRRLGVKTSV